MAFTHDSSNSTFAEQFRQIRQAFIFGLAKREAEIADACSREDLNAALHKLAGAAASFDFEELGQLARDTMELACHDDEEHLLKSIASLRHAMRVVRGAG